jgi:hypothetical protein
LFRFGIGRRAALVIGCAVTLGVAVPAAAHYANFTGSVYQVRFVPGGAERCFLKPSGSGCSLHSWSFLSAKNTGGTSTTICPRVYMLHPGIWDENCGQGLVRNCFADQQHGSNPLNCHDQDVADSRVVATRVGNPGTTVEMHGGY